MTGKHMAGKKAAGRSHEEELHEECQASSKRGKANTASLSRMRKRFHMRGMKCQNVHRAASFLTFSSTGKSSRANMLNCYTAASHVAPGSANIIALHIVLNGIFGSDTTMQNAAAKALHKAAVELLRLSNGRLQPKGANPLASSELGNDSSSSSCGSDSSSSSDDEE
ncbi:hypothetical protein V8C86DRAFT_3135265, partial [Haematococcus lacustris]